MPRSFLLSPNTISQLEEVALTFAALSAPMRAYWLANCRRAARKYQEAQRTIAFAADAAAYAAEAEVEADEQQEVERIATATGTSDGQAYRVLGEVSPPQYYKKE